MKLPDKVYDVLRWVCVIVLPALITFYGVLSATLNIPFAQETITIAIAFNTCLGAIFQISKISYDLEHKEE